MKDKNNVLIIIPTCNSSNTIAYTLKSIALQKISNLRIIVIDCYSKDNTLTIINDISSKYKMDIDIFQSYAKPLIARIYGMLKSYMLDWNIMLFLDSDQLFSNNRVLRYVITLVNKGYSMIVLEEKSLFLKKNLSSYLINRYRFDLHRIDLKKSLSRFVYPRVFTRKIIEPFIKYIISHRQLLRLFYNIYMLDDKIFLHFVYTLNNHQGDTSSNIHIAMVRNAIYHIEPNGISELFKKYLNYGKNVKENLILFYRMNLYKEKIIKDTLNVDTTFLFSKDFAKILINPIFITKALAYNIGSKLG